ncbi:MAG TPA: hypothetical protein VFA90_13705 [Terriglobales bacterium]|nr:hypothetical protein [Terriglobales bacterium]
MVAVVVSFTVAGSVALGITAAYASVLALLHAFAHNSPKPEAQRTMAMAAKASGS